MIWSLEDDDFLVDPASGVCRGRSDSVIGLYVYLKRFPLVRLGLCLEREGVGGEVPGTTTCGEAACWQHSTLLLVNIYRFQSVNILEGILPQSGERSNKW